MGVLWIGLAAIVVIAIGTRMNRRSQHRGGEGDGSAKMAVDGDPGHEPSGDDSASGGDGGAGGGGDGGGGD
jgi:hypothetical protein